MHKLANTPNIDNLNTINPQCKAILWDMDGTIMETEALHIKSTTELINRDANRKQLPILDKKAVEEICYGQTDPKILMTLKKLGYLVELSEVEFISSKDEIIKDLLDQTSETEIFNPEIRNFMASCSKKGIKQAVVTSSEKNITQVLLNYLNLNEYFDFVITREDTKENKPSPSPYLTAMHQFKLKPNDVIIFEDSKLGLEAAHRSNAPYCKAQWYSNSL